MYKWYRFAAIGLALAATASPAVAYDWEVTAKLTRVEGSFVPNHINRRVDVSAGSCGAGAWLFYYGNGATAQEKRENVGAMYAMLLTAMTSGAPLYVYGVNSGCVVGQIHLLVP